MINTPQRRSRTVGTLFTMTLVAALVTLAAGCSQGANNGQVDEDADRTVPAATNAGDGGKAANSKESGGKSGRKAREQGKSGRSGKQAAKADNDGGMPVLGPGRKQTDVLKKLPGSASKGCVVVGDRRDVRSGTMAAGPFDDIRRAYDGKTSQLTDRYVRLYIIPESSAKMPGVHVKMVHKATGQTVELDDDHVADAEEWKIYDIETALPTAGVWVIRAQAGPDSGCWEFDLT